MTDVECVDLVDTTSNIDFSTFNLSTVTCHPLDPDRRTTTSTDAVASNVKPAETCSEANPLHEVYTFLEEAGIDTMSRGDGYCTICEDELVNEAGGSTCLICRTAGLSLFGGGGDGAREEETVARGGFEFGMQRDISFWESMEVYSGVAPERNWSIFQTQLVQFKMNVNTIVVPGGRCDVGSATPRTATSAVNAVVLEPCCVSPSCRLVSGHGLSKGPCWIQATAASLMN